MVELEVELEVVRLLWPFVVPNGAGVLVLELVLEVEVEVVLELELEVVLERELAVEMVFLLEVASPAWCPVDGI